MSPIGGVGIKLAIQDAVAAANLLAAPLADDDVAAPELNRRLAQVQQRRLWPTRLTRLTQAMQVALQNRVLSPLLAARETAASEAALAVPWPLRLINRFPVLQGLPARLVGIGVRPEHVHSPQA